MFGTRRATMSVIALSSAVGLAACGGGGDSGSGGGGSPASGTSKSTMVVVSPVGVPSLDSQAFGTSTQQEVMTNVGEPMLRFKPLDTKSPQGALLGSDTEFVGGACKEHKLEGKTFSCTLGDFTSPYGNKLTSADVKFTLDYLIDAKANGLVGISLGGIDPKDPITIVDPTHLELNLLAPNTTLLGALTFWTFDPLDSTELKKHATSKDPFARKWMATHAAMFGAYNVTKFTPNQEVQLTKNPNYKGDPSIGVVPPSIPKVVYRAVPSDGTRAQLLASGTSQLTKSINVNLFQPLKGNSDVTTYKLPYLASPTLYFNVTKKPFDDESLRKAITCAVNRQAISDSVYQGQWKPAHSIVGPKLSSSTDKFDTCPDQDLGKAKSLLQGSGYKGETLPLYYSVGNSGQDAQENATLLQAQLSQAGIKTSLKAVPDATKFFTGAAAGQYGMFVFLYGANVPTAAWLLGAWFGPESSLNFTKFKNPQTEKHLAQLQRTPLDSPEQTAASQSFQQQFMQAAAVVPLVYQENDYIINKQLCDFRADPGDFAFWQFLKFCA